MPKRLFFAVLLTILLLSSAACSRGEKKGEVGADAPPDAVPEIAGKYVVNGFDPLGTEYSGHLTITPGDTPGAYHLQWIITGSIHEGTGQLEGNQLVVEWHSVEGLADQSQGSAVYTVTVDGELYGTRRVDGADDAGTETAYPNQ